MKLLLFFYWAWHYDVYSKPGLVKNHIAVELADTDTYYNPIDTWLETGEYPTMCRMPGLAPLYMPFYKIFGKQGAYISVVVLQFLFSFWSTFLLALTAARLSSWKFAFQATALIYSLSAFIAVWENCLLSDSYAVSFLVISLYHFTTYLKTGRTNTLFYAGFWLCWSMFIRQIAVIAFPVALLLLVIHHRKKWRPMLRACFVFFIPLILIDGWWLVRNYQKEKIIIPLVKPITDCWQSYSKQLLAINDLQITWGEDVQYWIANSSAAWFNASNKQEKAFPFREATLTSSCNLDSILSLQHDYVDFRFEKDSTLKAHAGARVLSKCAQFKSAYISEHPFDYWVIKRLIMVKMFVFPLRHDNLPGPSFAEMNWFQKAIKSGYLFLLMAMNFIALFAIILAFVKRNQTIMALSLLPIGIIAFLAVLLGYIEQRYFVPVYPFFLIISIIFIGGFFKNQHHHSSP